MPHCNVCSLDCCEARLHAGMGSDELGQLLGHLLPGRDPAGGCREGAPSPGQQGKCQAHPHLQEGPPIMGRVHCSYPALLAHPAPTRDCWWGWSFGGFSTNRSPGQKSYLPWKERLKGSSSHLRKVRACCQGRKRRTPCKKNRARSLSLSFSHTHTDTHTHACTLPHTCAHIHLLKHTHTHIRT